MKGVQFSRIFVSVNEKIVIARSEWLRIVILGCLALIISLFSLFPAAVEKGYSVGLYPYISLILRVITRWIPFSIWDIGYSVLLIILVIRVLKLARIIIKKQYSKALFGYFCYRLVTFLLWVYIIFKLIWALNYDRLGIAYQLSISPQPYTKEEVTSLTNQLIDKVNTYRKQLPDTVLKEKNLETIYAEAFRSYQNASTGFPFLQYRNLSVKGSLFSGIGDYLGFSGYYNPFTGEAQVRTDIPRVLIPYITCHEMAHQLGYASESEANFVGYIAASSSKDPYFLYSVYLDLFSYAQGEEIFLYGKDKDYTQFAAVIRQNRLRLDTLVKLDRRAIREFFNKRKNSISPAVSNLYDQYLKLNKQSAGVNSYNEVIGWLIAYQKKYGKI